MEPISAIRKLASSFSSGGAALAGASFLKNSLFLFDATVDASFCSLELAFVRLTCSSDCVSEVVSWRMRPLLLEGSVAGRPTRPNFSLTVTTPRRFLRCWRTRLGSWSLDLRVPVMDVLAMRHVSERSKLARSSSLRRWHWRATHLVLC